MIAQVFETERSKNFERKKVTNSKLTAIFLSNVVAINLSTDFPSSSMS